MSDSKPTRNSEKNSEVALVVPAHGRGALLTRGMPGNKGGGRPRSKVKALSALEYEKRIPALGAIADDEAERATDRIRAIDVLGRHGGLQVKGLDRDGDYADDSEYPFGG